MAVVVIEPPAPLVGISLAIQHLKLDDAPSDIMLVEAYIAAASAMIDGPDGWLGRSIGTQTLELQLDGFAQPIWGWSGDSEGLFWSALPSIDAEPAFSRLALPFPPFLEVVSVTYEDAAGNVVPLPSSEYLASDEGFDAEPGTTLPLGRWSPGAVKIRYTAGYQATPAPIVAAVLLMVGDLYANRQTVEIGARGAAVPVPMSTTVETLLRPYRVFR